MGAGALRALENATIVFNRYTGPTSTGTYLGNVTGPVGQVTVKAWIKQTNRAAVTESPAQSQNSVFLRGRVTEVIIDGVTQQYPDWPSGMPVPGQVGDITLDNLSGKFYLGLNTQTSAFKFTKHIGRRITGEMVVTSTYGTSA